MTSGSTLNSIVLFNADAWEHVCPTVRITEPAETAGINVLPGCTWDERGQLQIHTDSIEVADLVIVQRDFPRHVDAYQTVVETTRSCDTPLVYELDDLLFDLPDWHPDYRAYRETRVAILGAAREADAVTTSTSLLREQLSRYNPCVYVIPNYLPDALWAKAFERPIVESQRDPIRIGYMGGHSHIHDIEAIEPVFSRLQHEYGDRLEFYFWGVQPPHDIFVWDNTTVENPYLVGYGEFADYFSTQMCDIFIAPLDDNIFNRCKSALKVLEYSALGVPGVYSDIAPYEQAITQGVNGYLASTVDEWSEYLDTLIESPSLRVKIGENARRTVLEKWLLSAHANEWREVYDGITKQYTQSADTSPYTTRTVRQAHAWHTELEEHISLYEQRIAEQQQQIEARNRQIEEHKHQIEERNRQIDHLNHRLNAALHRLDVIENSPGWKLIQLLTPIRETLLPRNGLLERALGLLSGTLGIIRRDGLGAGINSLRREIRGYREWKKRGSPTTAPQFATEIRPGERLSLPAISIIVSSTADVDAETTATWVSSQTLPPADVVVWDRNQSTAHIIDQPDHTWPAPNWPALREHLRTPYVILASTELLDWDPSYLEANLLALGTEDLVFTINTYAQPEALVSTLQQQKIPLQRSVIRVEYVDDESHVDLSALFGADSAGQQAVAGKILTHTSNQSDDGTASFDATVTGAAMHVTGQYILAAPPNDPSVTDVTSHTLHPVETVVPAVPETSGRPTVVTMFPFLAVGGAERVALDMMKTLHKEMNFVIATVEAHDPELGTMVDEFREITPYVYTAPDYVSPQLKLSFLTYLIERFDPRTLYIANGANWLYDVLGTIKERYPQMRTANQTYDYQFGWINRYTPDLVRHIDAHIGVNSRICQAYIERGAPAESVYEIEHVVDTSVFDPAEYSHDARRRLRQKLGIPAKHRVVTFIARIHAQKRPMDFVELARRLASMPDVTFLMVGDGPLAQTVDAEIARIDLDNLVRHPFYSPSSDIFAISDVVVLPSEYEGMPLVMLEAQAMGVPVVVTDVGNNREVLDLTGGGVVVSDIGDISGLKDGVVKMLQGPPNPEHIRQQVEEHLSLETMAEKYRRALLGA